MLAKSLTTPIVIALLMLCGICNCASAQSLDFSPTPVELEPGSTNQVSVSDATLGRELEHRGQRLD